MSLRVIFVEQSETKIVLRSLKGKNAKSYLEG